MRISWITESSTPATVEYGTSPGVYGSSVSGSTSSYKYMLYKSGEIHDVVIGPLTPNTLYYYRCGSNSAREFSFKTPPAQLPIEFAVVGDLGQTDWTNSTLQHIQKSNYDMLLLPGDLSYADFLQHLWDSFGRLVEPLASQRPWMVTQGNHEVERIPLIHQEPFTAYNSRWHMPFEESGSDSNLYYSFNVAGVHVIMLGSYTDFDSNSPQYQWLQADLGKIDRSKTPWIYVLDSCTMPWKSYFIKLAWMLFLLDMYMPMSALLAFTMGMPNNCGPVYINIGDGGNREGLASKYQNPKPDISLFREASFGHGELNVVNATHALWTWHRNDDDEAVVSESIWLTSLSSNPACKVQN
uniref:Purple acid phosphatase n=1 Tax=Fagus sylvatica TaxID=28930 RepID=A0A2N9H7F9_FAGSY